MSKPEFRTTVGDREIVTTYESLYTTPWDSLDEKTQKIRANRIEYQHYEFDVPGAERNIEDRNCQNHYCATLRSAAHALLRVYTLAEAGQLLPPDWGERTREAVEGLRRAAGPIPRRPEDDKF